MAKLLYPRLAGMFYEGYSDELRDHHAQGHFGAILTREPVDEYGTWAQQCSGP